ncbi:UDP-2,3-diacylglucosamine diphosphatase, partial [Providencia rettgeri]|nr:UDP-2,3-diacylglucosamine diphosphatase [Providencia rettgeri]
MSNKLTLTGKIWIAADLHLGSDNPDTLRDFLQFLHSAQHQAPVLILGGDIFNAWIG